MRSAAHPPIVGQPGSRFARARAWLRAARQEPEFRRIVATNERNVTFLNRRPVFVRNTNRLLRTFPGADGVKTGYTDAAGECLVASASRQGKSVVAVILNSDLRWEEAKYLLEYGFASL